MFVLRSFINFSMYFCQSSPADFTHTQEESTDESIATYKEFKRLVEEYADEHFGPSVVEKFCKRVYVLRRKSYEKKE